MSMSTNKIEIYQVTKTAMIKAVGNDLILEELALHERMDSPKIKWPETFYVKIELDTEDDTNGIEYFHYPTDNENVETKEQYFHYPTDNDNVETKEQYFHYPTDNENVETKEQYFHYPTDNENVGTKEQYLHYPTDNENVATKEQDLHYFKGKKPFLKMGFADTSYIVTVAFLRLVGKLIED
jgi:hypothetical protein